MRGLLLFTYIFFKTPLSCLAFLLDENTPSQCVGVCQKGLRGAIILDFTVHLWSVNTAHTVAQNSSK